MNHDQERRGQRYRHAMQNVKPVQGHLAHGPAAQKRELRVRRRRDQLDAVQATSIEAPGPSTPNPGVARAMFEPTVIAQIAS